MFRHTRILAELIIYQIGKLLQWRMILEEGIHINYQSYHRSKKQTNDAQDGYDPFFIFIHDRSIRNCRSSPFLMFISVCRQHDFRPCFCICKVTASEIIVQESTDFRKSKYTPDGQNRKYHNRYGSVPHALYA